MVQSCYMPQLPSALVVLAFLGTGLVLAAILVSAFAAFVFERRRLAGRLSLAGLAAGLAYLAALVTASLASRERVLSRGDRKYFCEIDCHLAYSLQAVAKSPFEAGTRCTVSLQTWFDPDTIASLRGNGPLKPNPREVFVVDESGRRYGPSPEGMAALERALGTPSTPLSRELRPGESYTTTLVFDLPRGVARPRLFVGDPPGPECLLIDHENSFLHKKIYFGL